jgi:hypothetical protein
MNERLLKETLTKSAQKGLDFYSKITFQGSFKHFVLELNCAELAEIEAPGVVKHDLPESVKISFFRKFDSLMENINQKSCIYFFEFEENMSKLIHGKFIDFIDTGTERNVSAIKSRPNFSTQVLYLGKVKRGVGARLATHFGYANPNTGGLQLKFWAKQMDLKLKVNLLVFDDPLDDFINPLELELTKELKPLIGRSK